MWNIYFIRMTKFQFAETKYSASIVVQRLDKTNHIWKNVCPEKGISWKRRQKYNFLANKHKMNEWNDIKNNIFNNYNNSNYTCSVGTSMKVAKTAHLLLTSFLRCWLFVGWLVAVYCNFLFIIDCYSFHRARFFLSHLMILWMYAWNLLGKQFQLNIS